MDYIHTREDLEVLRKAFLLEGEDSENHLSLSKEQFSDALVFFLGCGSREEYGEFFDKIDTAKEGTVDWDKFAGYMLMEFYERDDHVKSTQVIQWQDLRILSSPHKDVIQKVSYLKNIKKYIAISKEGIVSTWDMRLRLQRTIKIVTESCSARDLWVTSFVALLNINKLALSFTSKEIAIYDLSTNMEFNCQYKIQGLGNIPLCLDYWSNSENTSEAILLWGDAAGFVTALHFTSANISLFERPSAPAGEKQDTCTIMQLKDIANRKFKNVQLLKTHCHNDWVRQVLFIPSLECFISCSTTWNNSLVLGWMEKNAKDAAKLLLQGHRRPVARRISRKSVFQISQGVNAFDYHEKLNLIASAGVNNHVCLWNPYVISKPTGLLRGHMTSVVQVKFIKCRGQLVSFSKDKVLRIWDVQLQVCIQRLAGMFPKGQEVSYSLYFDESMIRLFLTFNSELTVLEMKHEIKDRVMSHSKPVVGVLYNRTYGQVVSASKDGTLNFWVAETGKKVKQLKSTHGKTELTCLAQDTTETRLLSGALDGTIKMWDFNGHCYHTMKCQDQGQSTDICQILSLKRNTLAVGWTRNITVFRDKNLENYFVDASEWIGPQLHDDDILALDFTPPNILASGSYSGEIIIWNSVTEQPVKRFQQRSKKDQLTRRKSSSTPKVLINGRGSAEERSTQGRSGALLSANGDTNDDQELESDAILSLCFLNGRSVGANLVSCGGSGWVRFWSTLNSETSPLVAEFMAHVHAGNIIMAVDKMAKWLVTGDQDGLIKVWDIANYCTELSADLVTQPPDVSCQFQQHVDLISSIEVFERNERTLILSGSADCSVQLTDIDGNPIGCFGQEERWKIEPLLVDSKKLYTEKTAVRENTRLDGDWAPDERAVQEPASYRVNSWDKTYLGKQYQELRVQKRERKQPSTIPDLPYLYWERTRKPPAGPHAALQLTEMKALAPLNKPDFYVNPHRYFSEQTAKEKKLSESTANQIQTKSLQASFDERTIFPQHLLDHEAEARLKYTYPKDLPAQAIKKSVTLVTKPTNISSTALANHRRSPSSPQKTKNAKNNL